MRRRCEYQYDDGGRKASGRKGEADDCVVRALAIAAGRDYGEVYRRVADAMQEATGVKSARNGVPKKVCEVLRREYGFEKVKQGRGPRMSYHEVAHRYRTAIVTTNKHVCAIVDGRSYVWVDRDPYTGEVTRRETRLRKAASVWVPVQSAG